MYVYTVCIYIVYTYVVCMYICVYIYIYIYTYIIAITTASVPISFITPIIDVAVS